MHKIILALSAVLLMIACGPEIPSDLQEVNKLEKDLELQPSPERAIAFLNKAMDYVNEHIDEYEIIKPILTKGVAKAKEHGMLSRASGFLFPLLKNEIGTDEFKKHSMDLGDIMYALNKKHVSNVIYKELLSKHGQEELMQTKKRLIDSVALARDDYMQYLLEQVVVNPDEFGINKTAALNFVDAAEAYALVAPQNTKTAEYLYRAAEAARSRRDFSKALSIYDWIIEGYPDHERAPTALFIKGFTIEQDLKREEEARPIYVEFLQKYPDHQMTSSVDFLLNNLGKSEAEILESLQKNKDKNQ